jgi:Lrp/AsnC family leucine-responsive transcriptional regulator
VRLQGFDLAHEKRNVELLQLLRADPRMTVSALARRIGMSAPAVRERLQRLEEAGIIRGYRLEIDPAALGYPIPIVIRVRPMPGKVSQVAQLAESLPQVVECHRITGEDCFFMKAYIEALDRLGPLLDRFSAYGETNTSVIQSSPVPLRSLPLPGERRDTRRRS